MRDHTRFLKPLIWAGLAFVMTALVLRATGWSTPDGGLQGTVAFWWAQQLDALFRLLIRCGSAALAAAVVTAIAARVSAARDMGT